MKPWLHKIEVLVDKLIPFLLIILLAIIIGEFGYHDFIEEHRLFVEILDGFIVFIFVLDLIFKYTRIKNIPKFLRASWIDILAIFPFFLIFRLFEGIAGIFGAGETIGSAQKIVHVGVEIEKEVGEAIKTGEKVTKSVSRSTRFSEFIRPVARSFRLFKFGNPEVQKEVKKDIQFVDETTDQFIIKAEKDTEDITKKAKKDTKKIIKKVENIPRHVKAALFYENPKIMKHVNEKINKQRKK